MLRGVFLGAAFVSPAVAADLTVGPGQQYATIAAAVAASQDGDTLYVVPGTYMNDFAEITTKITLKSGVSNGRVVVRATEPLPNEKGIFVTDTDVTFINFTFEGAHIPASLGQNGAGIRYQGGNLTVINGWFRNNQDGLLADADANGSVTIADSEFDHNGDASGPGSGYTHNLYVGAVGALHVDSCYFHDAIVGHEIKSRALNTDIRNNRIADRAGTASYSIDLPNGGNALIGGNQIEKGPHSENPTIITFGEEGNLYSNTSLSVTGNLLEDDLQGHTPLGVNNATSVRALVVENQLYGLTLAELVAGPVDAMANSVLQQEPRISTAHPFQY